MPEKDPQHWLYRLTPDEWLLAADNELSQARAAFVHKQQRPAVAHARRAAGMAWNALLWHAQSPELEQKYGRSYMEHLQALGADMDMPEELRLSAAKLVRMPLMQTLVTLGPHGDSAQADPAATIIEYVRRRLHPSSKT